jgi:ribonuclease HI
VFGKLLEKLLIKRMTYRALSEGKWRPEQFAFREATSATDALRTLVNRIRTAKAKQHLVIGVSLDLKSAFDNAWWPALSNRLRTTHCPRNVHRLILSYLENRTVTLDFADSTASKSMTKGCIQGSVCGPTFWNLILDELLEVRLPKGCYIQAYADDVMLIVEGLSPAEVQTSANLALEQIHDWGRSVHLTFSPAKTHAIAFSPKAKSISITMAGIDVHFTDEIKLLGVILDERLTFVRHAKYVVGKVSRTFKVLCKFVRPTWGIHPENVDVIYRRVIIPTITYASGIWGSAAKLESVKRLLRTFQRTFAIRCIRGFHTVSAISADAIAGFMPLHLEVLKSFRIEEVKASGHLEGTEVPLEKKISPENMIHPAKRKSITSDSVESQEEADVVSSQTNIYTDGSKLESGQTGCAFVIFHPSGRQETAEFRLADCCSVFQAEMYALDSALKWVLTSATTDVSIFTDSQSSIAAIKDRSNRNPLAHSIHRTLLSLNGKLDVRFIWTRAHIGIMGNEAADVAAKSAAESDLPISYGYFPLSYAKHEIQSESMDAWEREYTSATTGSTTRSFLPTIKACLDFRTSVTPSFELTQFLSGHGFHLSYLNRFHIRSTDQCPCGFGVQDVNHLLDSCPRFMSITSDFAARCAASDVRTTDLASIIQHPDLLESFCIIAHTIVSALKSFNSGI